MEYDLRENVKAPCGAHRREHHFLWVVEFMKCFAHCDSDTEYVSLCIWNIFNPCCMVVSPI